MPNRKRKHTWKSAAANRLLQLTGYPPSINDAVQLLAQELLMGQETVPVDLEQVAKRINYSENFDTAKKEQDDSAQDDSIHDDGLRFFELTGVSTTQRRWEFSQHLVHHFFASLKPRGFTKGIELERLRRMLAAELLLPTKAFREVLGNKLTLSGLLDVCEQFKVDIRLGAKKLLGIPYVAIFEVNQEKVLWSYGGAPVGLLINLEPDFQAIVQKALTEDFVSPARFFSAKRPWFGSRCIEWARPHLGKTLLLARLPRRDESLQAQTSCIP